MNNATLNNILKWLGRGVIGSLLTGIGIWAGDKWGKACDKASEENRLVGENNANRVGEYLTTEALPRVTEAATKAVGQTLDKTISSLSEKK